MSESQASVQGTPAVDPVAIEPTTVASEAKIDPIRPTGTDALMAESRPEVLGGTDPATSTTATGPAGTESKEQNVGDNAVMIEAQPITEGVLGYKAPGLVKSLRFAKKFFWLNEEAVEPQHLSNYLRNEKPEIGHHNAAHATQTGNGLFFFAKRVEDKAQPAGILNLSDVSDVTKDGTLDFSFKLHGHKHVFQAATSAERDSWLVAIESQVTDAKTSREGIVSSDGYKKHLETLGKPAAFGAVPAVARSASRPKKSMDDKARNGTQTTGGAAATSSPSTQETTKDKTTSRSQSRKRGSLFGTLLGKKEEHDEKKEVSKEDKVTGKEIQQEEKEEKKEEKAEKQELKKEGKLEKKAEKQELKKEEKLEKKAEKEHKNDGEAHPAPLNAAAIASRVLSAPIVPAEGEKAIATDEIAQPSAMETDAAHPNTTTRDAAPKPNKRNSIFGSIFAKKEPLNSTRDTREKDAGPAVPAKDSEIAPVSDTPSQPADSADTPVSQTTDIPSETSAPKVDTAATPAPTVGQQGSNSPTSKGGIFGFLKQKEAQQEEKKETKAEEKAGIEAPSTSADSALAAAAPENSSETTTPAIKPSTTSTTPDALKERRRSSFFGTLGGKKEKRSDVISDTEGTDGEGKKSASTKLTGLFRKPSRAVKGGSSTDASASSPAAVAESSEAPAPVSKDIPAITETSPEPHMNGNGFAEGSKENVGGNVPELVSAGHPQQTSVEAAA